MNKHYDRRVLANGFKVYFPFLFISGRKRFLRKGFTRTFTKAQKANDYALAVMDRYQRLTLRKEAY